MQKITVLSLSKSDQRGIKHPESTLQLDSTGVVGDVHASTSRPISIIDQYHIDKFREHTAARETQPGEFAENLRVEGLGNTEIHILDRFRNEKLEMEVVQKGKPFHREFQELGNYVMPRVGIFCRTLKSGELRPGDSLDYIPKTFHAHIITLSDRASKGEYEDKSGPEVSAAMEEFFQKQQLRFKIHNTVIPDDAEIFNRKIKEALDSSVDFIITTGGTGIGKRDITVDTIKPMLQKEIPGIMEMIRMKYGMEKPNALLSRSVAGVINETLVYTLPGSVKAVKEYMQEIRKTLYHQICMLHALDVH